MRMYRANIYRKSLDESVTVQTRARSYQDAIDKLNKQYDLSLVLRGNNSRNRRVISDGRYGTIIRR